MVGPTPPGAAAASPAQLRLMTAVARLYHVRGVRQRDIGARLQLSQPQVSRLLAGADALGIVRTLVVAPPGLHPELEEAVEERHGLPEVHVVDAVPDAEVPRALGRAAAQHFSTAWPPGAVVGLTSWSSTLREMAAAMTPVRRSGVTTVVELLGDLGAPPLQHEATRATNRLAAALEADPVFLRSPGVVASPRQRAAALGNPHVARAVRLMSELDVAFVGVGPADVHGLLRAGDDYFSDEQLALARGAGAVAQLDQRFVDVAGAPVVTVLDDLVLGVTLAQLRRARRRVVVAGGASKHLALRACLAGGWVDVLVTDAASAEHLATTGGGRALS